MIPARSLSRARPLSAARCGRSMLGRMAILAIVALVATPAQALLKFNDGRDQINLTLDVAIGYDSNIFTYNGGDADTTFDAILTMEYLRRAGLIGVNGRLGWKLSQFGEYTDQNFSSPSMGLELTKDTGRTTGTFTLSADHENKPDPNLNNRTDSWNYAAGLNLKYPVIERYSLVGNFGYSLCDYTDDTFLVDLDSYSLAGDIFYVWTSERDLFGGYRLRVSNTGADTQSTDHAFTVGVSGKILAKLNGSVRAGYQVRKTESSNPLLDDTFHGLTSTVSSTWNVSKRFNITGQISKDFSTSSTNVNIDGTSVSLDSQYSFNSRFSLFAGVGGGMNRFLGKFGAGRRDYYFNWTAGPAYTFSEKLRASLTYGYFQNWSTLSRADFVRESYTLNLVSRW